MRLMFGGTLAAVGRGSRVLSAEWVGTWAETFFSRSEAALLPMVNRIFGAIGVQHFANRRYERDHRLAFCDLGSTFDTGERRFGLQRINGRKRCARAAPFQASRRRGSRRRSTRVAAILKPVQT